MNELALSGYVPVDTGFTYQASFMDEKSTSEFNDFDVQWDQSVEKAQKEDYLVSAACGALSAVLDVLRVNKFDLNKAKDWNEDDISHFIKCMVSEENKFNKLNINGNLSSMVEFIESVYPDSKASAVSQRGGSKEDYRNLAYCSSMLGLCASLFTQFTGTETHKKEEGLPVFKAKAIVLNPDNQLKIADINTVLIGDNNEEKVFLAVIEWLFYLVRSAALDKLNHDSIPGSLKYFLVFIDKAKNLSNFKDFELTDDNFRHFVANALNNEYQGSDSIPGKFDLHVEMDAVRVLGAMSLPLLLNECLVRGYYFVNQLVKQIKAKEVKTLNDFGRIDMQVVLPFDNAAIRRMSTVSRGFFVAINATTAMIFAALKYKKNNGSHAFAKEFILRLNFIGIGSFSVSFYVDLTESIKNRSSHRKSVSVGHAEDTNEFDLDYLSLDMNEVLILNSVKKAILDYDIRLTKKPEEIDSKKAWRKSWESMILNQMNMDETGVQYAFMSEEDLIETIEFKKKTEQDSLWLHLIMVEAALFEPYEKSLMDDGWKLKGDFKHNYLKEVLCKESDAISSVELKKIYKANSRYYSLLNGGRAKIVLRVLGTGIVVVGSAGAAVYFAPVIAPAVAAVVFGDTVAGLSGAALVSASLAALGGGSLAAGGFGMAGGTVLIGGGGALLGLAGSSGASAVCASFLLSSNGYVLDECVKLLVICDVVFHGEFSNQAYLKSIYCMLSAQYDELNRSLEDVNERIKASDKADKDKARVAKSIKKNLKYYAKTMACIKKFID